jgi:Cft2 family RNA processing exonuclease
MLPRDWELLAFIEEQGFASFSQICRRFFSDKKSNCSKRLDKLQFFRYLGSKKLFDFFRSGKTNQVKQGYFPHLLNLNISPRQKIYFIHREYARGFGKSSKLFKSSMVLHQLIMNELRVFLDEEIAHKMLFNDPKLQILSSIQSGRNKEIVPDLSYEYNKVKIAVELERTPKGMIRYFERFSFFRDSIYTHIIYYYTDERQLKNLLKRAGNSPKFAFAHYQFPDELYSPAFGPINLNDFIHKSLAN